MRGVPLIPRGVMRPSQRRRPRGYAKRQRRRRVRLALVACCVCAAIAAIVFLNYLRRGFAAVDGIADERPRGFRGGVGPGATCLSQRRPDAEAVEEGDPQPPRSKDPGT